MATRRESVTFFSAAAAAVLAIFVFLLLNPSQWNLIWLGDSKADLVVRNATIYTSDASISFAEAMAVRKGRIVGIGSDDSVRGFIGDRTRQLNLEGKVVLPGFIDSHVHLIFGGLQMGHVNLHAIKRKEDFVMRVKEAVKDPSGLLIDSAMKLVLSVIPETSVHERRDAMIRASKYALMKGVTTMVDMGRYFPGAPIDHSWQDFSDVYKWADFSGNMLIRVCLFFPLQTWSRVRDLFKDTGRSLSQWIHIGGVKAFADGSLGSNSALFHEPYEDDPHNYGLQMLDFDWLLNATVASDKSGLQVAVHAIGDKANDMVLDLFNLVKSVNEGRDHRFRIEHAQHLVPETTRRFGLQGVIASVQPDHILDDANSAEKKIGKIRAQKGSYLFKSLLIGGAKLAFGSDWPVADINPLRSIRTAMTRIAPGQETAWIPSERVGLDDALNAYTIGAAYACFLDGELGSLSPGKYADFIILPSSSWEEFETSIPSSVSATYVGGLQAYP